MSLFTTRDVTRVYRAGEVRALDGVTLSIERGAFAVLTGPSGCGKTTLLALLAGLDRPTEGSVAFDARDLSGASEAERARIRRRLGIVFQHAPMLRGAPVWENVTLPLVPRGTPARRRREIARDLLARVGLEAKLHARPEELSGGERQRAGVARALVDSPEALLADEPTSDLDPDSAAAVVALLREAHARGATLVVATHDPSLIEAATAVHRMRAGRLVVS